MKVKLSYVRLSFPELFEPKPFEEGGVKRYDATFLIEPGSANDQAVMQAIQKVADEKFGKKAAATLASLKGNANKFCYLDGNLKEYDGYQGMRYLASHRKEKDGRPGVYDANKSPLTERDGRPYGGCYVNATVDIYAQDGQYAGIRCGLIAVQFAGDGDAFGGASKPSEDDFEDLAVGADASADVGGASSFI